MSNLQVSQSFEDKMKDRIRDSIGDLITDEDLSKLIHKGIEDVFLNTRSAPAGTYGRTETKPPLINEIVKELLEAKVRVAVDSWIYAHPEEVTAVLEKALIEGIGNAVIRAMDQHFSCALLNFKQQILDQIQGTRYA